MSLKEESKISCDTYWGCFPYLKPSNSILTFFFAFSGRNSGFVKATENEKLLAFCFQHHLYLNLENIYILFSARGVAELKKFRSLHMSNTVKEDKEAKLLSCAGCKQLHSEEKYSKKQLKRKGQRLCSTCVERNTGKPNVAK